MAWLRVTEKEISTSGHLIDMEVEFLAVAASELTRARIYGTLRMKIGNSWAGCDKFKFGHACRLQL